MGGNRGYGQFCPVAKAAEIISEKWSLIIIRELLVGAKTFNDLKRGMPLVSPTLLSTRVKEFEKAGIVVKTLTGLNKPKFQYALTESGRELGPIIMQIGDWGNRWVGSDLREEDYDPRLLMWDIKRTVALEYFPPSPHYTVEFNYQGLAPNLSQWWIVVEKGEVDVCMKDPGHEINLYINCSIQCMVHVWMGKEKLKTALKKGEIELDGRQKDRAAFPRWFTLNLFAHR